VDQQTAITQDNARSLSGMSAEELQVRIDLAACYRLIALNQMDDLIATHISARVPGAQEHFLVNPYGLLFSQVTASNLVKVDLEGRIVEETAYKVNPAGFVIHSAVHAARPDAKCVIHTHTIAGMAVSCLEVGLLPLSQKSLRFYNRVAYHDYEGKSDNIDERERLAVDLGKMNAMILRNHGLLVCGPSVKWAYKCMMSLEKSCKVQLAVTSTGAKITQLTPEVMEHAAKQFDRDETPGQAGRPDGWPALLKMLDGIDPGYRN
jgi:ribulose-5-phosphate 4-epimerase/fuculose-1-phosphate aldolase